MYFSVCMCSTVFVWYCTTCIHVYYVICVSYNVLVCVNIGLQFTTGHASIFASSWLDHPGIKKTQFHASTSPPMLLWSSSNVPVFKVQI